MLPVAITLSMCMCLSKQALPIDLRVYDAIINRMVKLISNVFIVTKTPTQTGPHVVLLLCTNGRSLAQD